MKHKRLAAAVQTAQKDRITEQFALEKTIR